MIKVTPTPDTEFCQWSSRSPGLRGLTGSVRCRWGAGILSAVLQATCSQPSSSVCPDPHECTIPTWAPTVCHTRYLEPGTQGKAKFSSLASDAAWEGRKTKVVLKPNKIWIRISAPHLSSRPSCLLFLSLSFPICKMETIQPCSWS